MRNFWLAGNQGRGGDKKTFLTFKKSKSLQQRSGEPQNSEVSGKKNFKKNRRKGKNCRDEKLISGVAFSLMAGRN